MADTTPSTKYGVSEREPTDSELEWFKQNPSVPGMATEDGQVIRNPFSDLPPEKMDAVMENERARAFMRQHKYLPTYDITPEQMDFFAKINNGQPYGNEDDIRQTIAGRGFSGDNSAGELTLEQVQFIEELRKKMLKREEFAP